MHALELRERIPTFPQTKCFDSEVLTTEPPGMRSASRISGGI